MNAYSYEMYLHSNPDAQIQVGDRLAIGLIYIAVGAIIVFFLLIKNK